MSFSVIIRKTKAGDIFLYQFVLVISVCICIMRHRSGSKTTRKLQNIDSGDWCRAKIAKTNIVGNQFGLSKHSNP